MGSLTVRNIDAGVIKALKLRAAGQGRSMEEEVRHILAATAADTPIPPPVAATSAGRLPADPADAERPRILLVIGGGIAAYKSLDLIRRLKERGLSVRVVMTAAAQQFITPLAAGAIAGQRPFTDLFDTASEFDIGHIRLAREASIIVVAPATADLMAKVAGGHADDLASTVLLATDRPILLAPAMNPTMWANPATRRNVERLTADGHVLVGPNSGAMAERGEAGLGRMAEPLEIVAATEALLRRIGGGGTARGAMAGRRVLVTSGPTHEPIDPVRYIANRSSGKQGHAIAAAAAEAGALVTLITGPVALPDPPGARVIRIESARDMLAAVEHALPVDVAIFAAAVADWRVSETGGQKIKKGAGAAPRLSLVENPDILATIAARSVNRPPLVIGFAAETENVVEHAKAKLARKRCDWILANDVSAASGVMGGDSNTVTLVTAKGTETWPTQTKDAVARQLVARIAGALNG